MAYTPPVKKTIQNSFGGQVTDGNRLAMAYGNAFQTIDGTGTPVTSPATVNTTQTLIVPTNAVSCMIVSTTNPVQVSEDSTQTAFFTVPAGVPVEFDCARLANIYLKAASSTVVSFLFKTV